ncbi:transcriptional repressor [Mycobacterium sp. E802]|uniref:ROK family transcriptional regulator n=1 Tax=Mycobacterium sp. E802 TaxID=1834152 RepID=UPI0007FF7108|nr:ROK family transcriptional regulator [Mycobacterium sp. E802]OBG85186.1 transcriptional repressor [Mycobacterium sp. E802]
MLHLLHRQRVVHLLRTEGPLARADLADQLGLSRPAITAIVGELIDDGTLVELDSRVEGPGYRGRPRKLLGCNPQARRVLGIWIDERRARVVVADATGTIFREDETPTPGRTPASVIRSIIRIATQLIDDPSGGPVAAAGICLPGFIDSTTGLVVESASLGWSRVELGGPISRALGIPTAVQDTTQAMTLAETIAGDAREVRSALVLDCGGHVNVGLIIGGRPYTGATGVAGAVGHMPVSGSDAQCSCGRTGCVNASMSLHAMQSVAPYTEGVPLKDIDLDAVAQETSRNTNAQKLIREVIDRIAHTAILMEAVLDPEVLILSGLITEFEDLIDALETRIEEIRPPERRGRTATVRSQIGRDYRVAVIVALQQLDPDIAGLVHTPTP